MANNVDPDEVAHQELPHLDLHCLQIQLVSYFDALGLKHSFRYICDTKQYVS